MEPLELLMLVEDLVELFEAATLPVREAGPRCLRHQFKSPQCCLSIYCHHDSSSPSCRRFLHWNRLRRFVDILLLLAWSHCRAATGTENRIQDPFSMCVLSWQHSSTINLKDLSKVKGWCYFAWEKRLLKDLVSGTSLNLNYLLQWHLKKVEIFWFGFAGDADLVLVTPCFILGLGPGFPLA